LPMILNPKTVDPRDKNSPGVYQIETAMGAAISLFDKARAVEVPVERFRPVKKCADLLAIRSDCFVFDGSGRLIPNPQRRLGRLQIHLDPDFFSTIDDFEKRFGQEAPSLIECESLTIQGDVYFEEDVVVKGHVRLLNPHTKAAVVSAGTVLEGNTTF
jgi:UTP--glucose-1-phosphate uridylyltransferase